MRNYWALLPAVAVCVVLALLYVVPTLVNPQIFATIGGMFRQDDGERAPTLSGRERRARRLTAIVVLAGMLALVGFNISLNREANGCYQAAKAWGADDSEKIDDPCIDKIFGDYLGNPDGKTIEKSPLPVKAYQVVEDDHPKYLRWIANRPSYKTTNLLVGAPNLCSEVKFTETDEAVRIVDDRAEACPSQPKINLVAIELDKPLGDRKVITVGDRPVERIDPDLPSWGTVLKKLATGG